MAHKNKSSVLWIIIMCCVAAIIISAHIFGIGILSRGMFTSVGYVWPILFAGIGAFLAWHLMSLRHVNSHQVSSSTVGNVTDIISRNGLHWHPSIEIYVGGVKQEIPQTGITNMTMNPLHRVFMRMHGRGRNEQGIIHLKFAGNVYKTDIMLGQVFKQWNKTIHTYGEKLHMTVNGQINTEYENYVMRDHDKIVLKYE